MDPAEALRRSKAARATWFELDDPPRRALQLQRPSEKAVLRWRQDTMTPDRLIDLTTDCVIGWRGFTEADLLGAAVGASDEQEFSRELFVEWADDHVGEMTEASRKLFEMIGAYSKTKEETAKN